MTPAQFDALAELAGLRTQQTRDVVRLMLIDGLGPTAAAERIGMSQPAASQALARVRRVQQLAQLVAGPV
jgi:DNA-directed RNA polymerase specialized sigma24 family protein